MLQFPACISSDQDCDFIVKHMNCCVQNLRFLGPDDIPYSQRQKSAEGQLNSDLPDTCVVKMSLIIGSASAQHLK